MRNYYKLALNRKQQRLAKRLAELPRDERFYDPELQELDQKHSQAALVVLFYAEDLEKDK